MNEETIMRLCEALGVDPNAPDMPEQLLARIDEVRALLSGGGEAEAAAQEPQLAAMRSALQVENNAQALERMDAIKAAVEAYFANLAARSEGETGELPTAWQFNPEALGAVNTAVGMAVKHTQRVHVPFYVGQGTTEANKSAGFNINRGAKKPTLFDAVMAIAAGDNKGIKATIKGRSERAAKAQGVSENVLGGYIVREEIAQDFLEPLYATEVVMDAGATVVPMDGIETLTIRKDTGGSTAYWVGEHLTGTQSDNDFGVVRLSLKELLVEKRVGRRLLRAAPGAEQRFINDMRRAARLKMDLSFLMGTGAVPGSGHTGAEPTGLFQVITNQASSQITTVATNGKKIGPAEIGAAVSAIKQRNIEESDTWGIIMHTAVSELFSDLTDTAGNPIMRDNWAGNPRPTIRGLSRYATTQIPTNITVGTNTSTSYVFVGDWANAFIGMGNDVEVVVDESIYRRERDVLIQATLMVDFAVAYTEAFQILRGVNIS